MQDTTLLIAYHPTNTNSVNLVSPSMKQFPVRTVLMTKPRVQPGLSFVYLLPKAVAQFNKDHGKNLVV